MEILFAILLTTLILVRLKHKESKRSSLKKSHQKKQVSKVDDQESYPKGTIKNNKPKPKKIKKRPAEETNKIPNKLMGINEFKLSLEKEFGFNEELTSNLVFVFKQNIISNPLFAHNFFNYHFYVKDINNSRMKIYYEQALSETVIINGDKLYQKNFEFNLLKVLDFSLRKAVLWYFHASYIAIRTDILNLNLEIREENISHMFGKLKDGSYRDNKLSNLIFAFMIIKAFQDSSVSKELYEYNYESSASKIEGKWILKLIFKYRQVILVFDEDQTSNGFKYSFCRSFITVPREKNPLVIKNQNQIKINDIKLI